MTWIMSRKVSITTCRLSKVVSPALYMPFFAYIGNRLETLKITNKDAIGTPFIQMISCISSYCTNIKEISMKNCSSVNGLENILWNSQKTISTLILDGCDLSGLQVDDWKLPSLLLLSINNCENTNDLLPQLLRAAPNLEILSCPDLSYWPDEPNVGFSPTLRVIALDFSNITDAAFSSLVHSCPMLEVVHLSDCSLLTDVSVLELVQHAKHLSALLIGENDNFTDAALEAIAAHCGERLRHLYFADCSTITDAGLKHISEACHQLQGLAFDSNVDWSHLSIAAIQAVLRSNPLLQEVRLQWEVEDADVLLTTLAESCPQLHHLNIYGLSDYTEVGVMAVMTACSRLRTVVVDPDCTVINPLAQCLWRKYCSPEVQFVDDEDEDEDSRRMRPFWTQYRSLEFYC